MKVVQISALTEYGIYGLGDDGQLYFWQNGWKPVKNIFR